jgi:RPA family protein
MALQRSVAYKVRIKDITEGEFVKGEGKFGPNQIITPLKEEVSRVRVLGTVVSRFIAEDRKFGSLTLDDGTDTIAVRAFRDGVELMEEVKTSDIVDVVGKVKEYNGEKYINLESAKVIKDPNWEMVRKLELLLKVHKLGGEVEVPREKAGVEEEVVGDPKMIILNLIEELDEGEGVKYITLLSESGLEDEQLEEVLGELMGDGEIYEPKIGRFKQV